MKRDLPRSFVAEYAKRSKELRVALGHIRERLQFRLRQRRDYAGTRARVIDDRLKAPGRIWRKIGSRGLSIQDAFTKVDVIQQENFLEIQGVKDMVSKPSTGAYCGLSRCPYRSLGRSSSREEARY